MLAGYDKDCHQLIRTEAVEKALKADRGDSATVSSWKAEDFTSPDTNKGTIVTRVYATYSQEGHTKTTSYIVKIKPPHMPDIGKYLYEAIFKKEQGFYGHVLSLLNETLKTLGQMPLSLPRFYYGQFQDDTGLIFLEDLGPRGFKMVDRTKGMDVTHAKLVLEELGRFHAASVLLRKNRPLDILSEEFEFLNHDFHRHPGPCREKFSSIFKYTFESIAVYLKGVGGYEDGVRWLNNNKENLPELLDKILVREDPFSVICHGDCWNNNMLFRYNEEGTPVEVMMLDLQLSRIASLAIDLNYMSVMCLKPEVKRPNEQELLRSYYQSFKRVLESASVPRIPFDFQQLMLEYKRKHEWALFNLALPFSAIVLPPVQATSANGRDSSEASVRDETIKRNLRLMDSKFHIARDKILAEFKQI